MTSAIPEDVAMSPDNIGFVVAVWKCRFSLNKNQSYQRHLAGRSGEGDLDHIGDSINTAAQEYVPQ
jgi:hypothetical protein